MLGRLLQIVRVCFLGEEKKTKLNLYYIKDIDFVRGNKAKKKTVTISKEQMAILRPKKLEFISFLYIFIQVKSTNP